MVVRNGGTDSSGGYLYIGFDNETDGIEIYRTDVADPSSLVDWEGPLDDATTPYLAAQYYIYDAISVNFDGTDYLYITVGDSASAVQTFRTKN